MSCDVGISQSTFLAIWNAANGLVKSTPSATLPNWANAAKTPPIALPMDDMIAITPTPVIAIILNPCAIAWPAAAAWFLNCASLTSSPAKSRKIGIKAWAIWFFAPCTDKFKSSVEVFNSWVARMVFSSIVAPAFSAAVAQRSKPLPPSLRYGISNDASSATDSM